MEKSVIQNYIDTAIAGQGNQVDLGNVLPKVLGGILAGVPLGGDESVSVIVRGCKYVDDTTNEDAPVVGGKVIVKTFDPVTKETAAQEFEIPASGLVVFPVRHGLVYQVHSEVEGLAASTRLVFTSSQDARTIYLWNTSIGVYKFGYNWAVKDDRYRGFPFLVADGAVTTDNAPTDWDIHDDEKNAEEANFAGILVATASTSFIITPGALHVDGNGDAEGISWSRRAFGKGVPGIPKLYEEDPENWQADAKKDFDGGLNTALILAADPTAEAASFCAELAAAQDVYYNNFYLGGAGEMFALYENREAYAAIQEDYTDCPALGTLYYWSSSVYGRRYACIVYFDLGSVGYGYMGDDDYVLALSAFQFDY